MVWSSFPVGDLSHIYPTFFVFDCSMTFLLFVKFLPFFLSHYRRVPTTVSLPTLKTLKTWDVLVLLVVTIWVATLKVKKKKDHVCVSCECIRVFWLHVTFLKWRCHLLFLTHNSDDFFSSQVTVPASSAKTLSGLRLLLLLLLCLLLSLLSLLLLLLCSKMRSCNAVFFLKQF